MTRDETISCILVVKAITSSFQPPIHKINKKYFASIFFLRIQFNRQRNLQRVLIKTGQKKFSFLAKEKKVSILLEICYEYPDYFHPFNTFFPTFTNLLNKLKFFFV